MRSLKEVTRYEDLAFYEWKALATKLGGLDNVLAVIQGEKAVKIEELIKLFDKNGRRIPPKGFQNNACDPNKDFYLVRPEFKTIDNYAQRLIRYQQMFSTGPMSVAEFEGKTKEMVNEIKNSKLLAPMLNGVYLPIVLPEVEAKNFDYGTTLENVFLSAVKKAYEAQFPVRNFYYRKGELANQVSIVEGSRHEILIERMKEGTVYVIYFPNPLQGFSVFASREQMKDLPESLILSGGFDASVAMVMFPDVLARDFKTPGYDLSALLWRSPDYSFYFRARDDRLYFYHRAPLGSAIDYYSSGLLFLGSA